MPHVRFAVFGLFALSIAALQDARAEAPIKIADVASAADLAVGAKSQVAIIAELLKDSASFTENQKKVPHAAGVLACLAQALTEHPDVATVGIAAPTLRDAALGLRTAATLEQATVLFTQAQEALAGKANESSSPDADWAKLIRLHDAMEEMNARNSKIRRAVRRMEDPEGDSLNATVIAVLAVATYADTHEVKNEADLPQWQQFSADFQKQMTALATAIRNKDTEGARVVWLEGVKACNSCHDVFRKE